MVSRRFGVRRWLACAALSCAAPLGAGLTAGVAAGAEPITKSELHALQASNARFERFIAGLWPEARALGISRATFDAAFRDMTPDPKIIAQSHKQAEFVRPIWDYIAAAVAPARLSRGQRIATEWAAMLDTVERVYGVPKGVVLGIWGVESNFGSFTGNTDVVRALATLAFVGYRGEFFRHELLTALQIIEGERVPRPEMGGSWAGAMGQTQFMPTSFVKYAVDGDGDGRRNIWTSMPDALASTANFLRAHGWQPGLPWGFEVELPARFDFRHHNHSFAGWARLGVRRTDRTAMPRTGEATLLLPGGARGPAFLVTDNYSVIKRYNPSDAYALGVGHLGDRIYGGAPILTAWPKDEPALEKPHREEVQRRLMALGLYAGETDGKLGSKTRDAVRQFQLIRGLVPDGYANWAVLKELRASP
jgi:membrane-bound lytic murein transglycosylase B